MNLSLAGDDEEIYLVKSKQRKLRRERMRMRNDPGYAKKVDSERRQSIKKAQRRQPSNSSKKISNLQGEGSPVRGGLGAQGVDKTPIRQTETVVTETNLELMEFYLNTDLPEERERRSYKPKLGEVKRAEALVRAGTAGSVGEGKKKGERPPRAMGSVRMVASVK